MKLPKAMLPLTVFALLLGGPLISAAQQATPYPAPMIPEVLQGPFISDPDVIGLLDQVDPRGCEHSGPLVFGCLIQSQADPEKRQTVEGENLNSFNLDVADQIVSTIRRDLENEIEAVGIGSVLPLDFLTSENSRIELVGIVNRMDRQFVHDLVPLGANRTHDGCGEISVVYRFAYMRDGQRASRLPVTMNVVFPAIPTDRPAGAATCRDIASRWIGEMNQREPRSPQQIVTDLQDPSTGVLASITGRDIFRIEINMQAHRIPVSGAIASGLGSTAKYILRVFRWDPDIGTFLVSHLNNQIDRARLTGDGVGDDNSCGAQAVPGLRERFIRWLTNPVVLEELDRGTLNVPLEYLACRAVTVSPGGQTRSENQPYWNAPQDDDDVITDMEIRSAIQAYLDQSSQPFGYMKSVEDFRSRLNDTTCSGCHQARAIAGFHFPGADRAGTPSFNAVLLPGSPHFYGDQPRRRMILKAFADDSRVLQEKLATSYAARPLNRYNELRELTSLLGGWGGTCLLPDLPFNTQREWSCSDGFQCKAVFASTNAPGVGTCVPKGGFLVGDAMQFGTVSTSGFGADKYSRMTPTLVGKDTRIEPPPVPAPRLNSYYVAHQEWYKGTFVDPTTQEAAVILRDASTGGFPGGMLRLSECLNLPPDATCGLTASTGFNDCIKDTSVRVTTCFTNNTAFAGLRGCDAARPCRDDYICLQPLSAATIASHPRPLREDWVYFGAKRPDFSWLPHNAGRGYCMPPYFVLQFRVDGHPAPAS